MNIFDSKEYKLSRKAYIAQCTFEYFITLLVADAYLAKLLSYIGLGDSAIGIITSLSTFGYLFMLPSVFIAQKIRNVKWTVTPVIALSQLMFMSLYAVPFMKLPVHINVLLCVFFIFTGHGCHYIFYSVLYKWGNSHVHPQRRAEFSAGKEIISLISGMLFTLLIGYLFDKFEEASKPENGFLFAAGAILILAICNFACLSIMKNMENEPQEQSLKFRDVIKNTFCNKGFISITVLTVLWNIAQGTTIGFLGIYKTKELAFSIATIQIINIVGNAARVVISRPLGRYSDKTSFAKGIKLAVMLAGVAFLINSFTTPETRWLIVVYTILHSCCIAGTNQNMYNITYSYVPKEYFSQALAIKNCIGGLFGFAASLTSGRIVTAVQANSNTFFGVHIYAQQILSFISFIMCILIIAYITLVVEKQKSIEQ